jgi:hypothetical protein
MASKTSKPSTVGDNLKSIAHLLEATFGTLDLNKEAKAISKGLSERKAEFQETESRVERRLRGGVRKTKGDAI